MVPLKIEVGYLVYGVSNLSSYSAAQITPVVLVPMHHFYRRFIEFGCNDNLRENLGLNDSQLESLLQQKFGLKTG